MRPLPSARFALWLLLGSTACDTLPSRGTSADDDGTTDDRLDVGDGKPDVGNGSGTPAVGVAPPARRYVTLMKTGLPCAPVDGWSATPLFLLTNDARAAWGTNEVRMPKLDGIGMPVPLQRFCVHTWAGSGAPAAPPVVPGSVRVDPDPDVIVPQAGASRVDAARGKAVLQALGAAPGPRPAASPYTRAEGLPYVAIVDTADSRAPGFPSVPPYSTAAPRQQHGLMMALLVDAVRCPHRQAACSSRQFFAQAFPYDATTVEPLPSGGQRGSLGSLAAALGEAVARWRALPDAKSSPLVINMSLGWDVRHGGALPASHEDLLDVTTSDASVPATVQAVHHALAWAACEGALSIAAVGNAGGPLCEEQGTMAPAVWEGLPAPSLAACARLGVEVPAGRQPAKLVHGAGGLDGGERPIANSRLGSMPSRGLHAMQATAPADGGTYTQPWTGTSVAAAALSAIAAQAWSHGPSLSATDVMELVDTHGDAIALDARWQGPTASTPASIRRIDAHAVLAAIDPANNPYLAGPTGPSQLLTVTGHVSPHVYAAANLQPIAVTPTAHDAAACGGMQLQTFAAPGLPGSSPNPAPTAASAFAEETRPQPHVPICPNCPVVRKVTSATGSSGPGQTLALASTAVEYTLYVELDPHYASASVGQPVLSFYDSVDATTLSVELGPIELSTPTAIALHAYTLPSGSTLAAWLEGHAAVTAARLSVQVDEDGTGPLTARVMTQVVEVVREP